MPTTSSMKLPKPSSDEEFEKMCVDVLNKIYFCTFTRYGRKGQQQHGIDIVCSTNQSPQIAAQCKNYLSSDYAKFVRQISADIASAMNAPLPIRTFIVMTSLDLDTETQNVILNIQAPFAVKVLFWENIEDVLCQDSTLLAKYYPQLFQNPILPIQVKNRLIAYAFFLKKQASELSDLSSYYKIRCNDTDDLSAYNKCVDVFCTMCELQQIHDQWYLQLNAARITAPIERIIDDMPEFHDAKNDWTGATMVYTITEFLSYFSDTEKKKKFISRCDKIIERTTEI